MFNLHTRHVYTVKGSHSHVAYFLLLTHGNILHLKNVTCGVLALFDTGCDFEAEKYRLSEVKVSY